MKRSLPLTALALASLAAVEAHADVTLPAIISDHMVLQAGAAVPVWGWAEPGETVAVMWAAQTKSVTTGPDRKWLVRLDPLTSSANAGVLTIRGKNTVAIQDVLVGEVWLGSGQSNMALPVSAVNNLDAEVAAAQFPQLRMFKETSDATAAPQEVGKGSWQVTSPAVVRNYSAVAYFFGRDLHRALGVPVGMINSSVGGTPIESWISTDAQQKSPELGPLYETQAKAWAAYNIAAAREKFQRGQAAWKKSSEELKAAGKEAPRAPVDPIAVREKRGTIGGLFNGKIAPLIPYAVRGMLWYQGEANSAPAKAVYYERQLRLLIADWRGRWGDDFYFAWVQLPNFEGGAIRDWPMMREAMLKTLAVKKTGMAIAIDVGEANNIHPKNKQEVGRRLAFWALGDVYGKKVPATSGPLPAGHEVRGDEVVLRFSYTDGGLVAQGGELKGFTVAGEDRQWKPAQARIEGDRVVVKSPDVRQPVAVRYAWLNFPTCNLYNGAGLPASPFRTDSW